MSKISLDPRDYGLPRGTPVRRVDLPAGQSTVSVETGGAVVGVLEAGVLSAVWSAACVQPGASVGLVVRTWGAGEGAPVRVRVRDTAGRSVGAAAGQAFGGACYLTVDMPERASGALVADVELTDLGVAHRSAPLPVAPWVKLKRLRWEPGRAAEGDTVALVADVLASRSAEALVRQSQIDVDVLLRQGEGGLAEPVARLTMPASEGVARWCVDTQVAREAFASQADLDEAARRSGADPGSEAYRYVRPELVFRLSLMGASAVSPPLELHDRLVLSRTVGDEPDAGRRYTLVLPDGTERAGTLGSDGTAQHDDLPQGTVRVRYEAAQNASDEAPDELPPFQPFG